MRLPRRFALPSVCLACALLAACSPARETVAPEAPPPSSADSAALRVRADQALRPALEPLVRDYEARTKQRISLSFAPAAQVRARMAQGDEIDAWLGVHQDARPGRTSPQAIAQDRLCLLSAPAVTVAPATTLGTLLRKDVRLGVETVETEGPAPAWDATARQVFERAEQLQSGAYQQIQSKVVGLPAGQTADAAIRQGQIDVAIQGCISASAHAAGTPLHVTPLSGALDTGLTYTITGRSSSMAFASFAHWLQSAESQKQWRAMGLQAVAH